MSKQISVQMRGTEIFAFVNTPRKGSRSIRNKPMAFCAQNAKMTVEQILSQNDAETFSDVRTDCLLEEC